MAVFTSALLGGAGLFNLGAGLAAAVSAVALNAAVGIGVSLAATALSSGKGETSVAGVNGTLQAGGDIAKSFILGRRATAGSLVYANTWGSAGKTPNAYLVQVITLADLPVKSLLRLYVNGEVCTVDWASSHAGGLGHPVTEYKVGSTDYLWVKFYDGSQTVADPYLVSTFPPPNSRPYTSTRVGRGICYAVVTSRVNATLFSGFPGFRFELSGSRLYDVSKDSTAGGTGPQRWADPSTWGGDGDDLPVVQSYNIMRGIRSGGEWLYGLQSVAGAQLPAAHWVSQIAKCRAQVAGISGNEAQYLTSAEIPVNTEIGTSIELFLTGSQGRMTETGGIYKMRVGEPDAPVFDFSDGDVLSTEEQTFVPFFGLSETVNGISATYPEPEEGWNNKTAPPLHNAGFEAQDGGRRLLTDIAFDAVYRSSQVQRLQESALKEARRARRLTLVLPPQAQVLEPGDVVRNASQRNGFSLKQFRVDGVIDKANLDVILDITEVDPTDYAPPESYTPPVFSPLGPVRPGPQIMGGWSAVPSNIEGRRPAILVGCDDDVDDVVRVWVQVRVKATGAIVFDGDSTPYASPYSWLLSGAWCLSSTTYEVRGKYVPYSTRATEWGAWLEVTTGAYSDTDLLVGLSNLNTDVRNRFQELAQELDRLRRSAEELGIAQSLVAAGGELSRQSMLAELGDARAEIVEERLVRASETEALAVNYLAVAAQLANAVAAIVTEQTARVTGDSALATSIQTVNAEYGGRFAGGLIKFEAAAAPSGVDARFAVLLKGGTAESYKLSGLYIDLYTVGGVQKSRVAIMTDQFVVTDGSAVNLPLVYEGGVLKLANARVAWAQIDGVSIDWAEIDDAVINNAVFGTTNLDFSAVTNKASFAGSASGRNPSNTSTWTTFASLTVDNPNPNPAIIDIRGSVDAAVGGTSGFGTFGWRVINLTTGEVLQQASFSLNAGSGSVRDMSAMRMGFENAQGSNKYAVQASVQGVSTSSATFACNCKILIWKR